MGAFVENFNLVNCYVDTSYQKRNGDIITSKFSETEPQTVGISEDLTIVANDGYKLKKEFSFDFQFQGGWDYVEDNPWYSINQDLFKPLEKSLTWEWNFEHGDFKYKGLELDKSLIYEHFEDDTLKFIILMIGGYNPYKYTFVAFKTGRSNVEYDGEKMRSIPFSMDITNDYGVVQGSESILNNLVFKAETDKPLEPDTTKNLFNTYYLDSDKIEEIRQSGSVSTEIIINTYSYPIKFKDEQLKDTTIKTGYISQTIESKSFIKNITNLDIFIFDVPIIPDVQECYIRIPFNNNVNLKYEDIKGKRIRGYISYEVLTNTTTLFITDDVETLYKNVITIGIKVPFKPTGSFESYSETEVRLANEEPKLFIKGLGKSIKGNYLKGSIEEPIKNILKDELNMLNELLNKGVFLDDYKTNKPQ